MNLLDASKVHFDPIEHKYTDDKGNVFISASQLISKFKPKFDIDGKILKRCALKEGITEFELAARWQAINDESCNYGTSVHESLESYILSGEIKNDDNKIWVDQFAELKFKGKLFCEQRLYDLDTLIAGTTDLVEMLDPDKKLVNVLDFKTNKKLEKTNFWGGQMLGHLFYFPDANFYHYQIQLSLYAYLLEKHGYTINELTLIYFNPKTLKMELHQVEYRMLTIKTYLKPSENKGLGLFSNQEIKKGEIIWKEHSMFQQIINKLDFLLLDDLQKEFIQKYATYYQESEYYFLDLDDTRFINHSNLPNIEFTDEYGIAIKDIIKDEEITCDYVKLNPSNANLDFIKK